MKDYSKYLSLTLLPYSPSRLKVLVQYHEDIGPFSNVYQKKIFVFLLILVSITKRDEDVIYFSSSHVFFHAKLWKKDFFR